MPPGRLIAVGLNYAGEWFGDGSGHPFTFPIKSLPSDGQRLNNKIKMALKKSLSQLAHGYRKDPSVPDFPDDRPIIIFDGYCVLCFGWVSFVLRHDLKCRYRLMTAQSETGKALYRHYGLDPDDYETNVLLADGFAWFKSEGSIRMAEGLGLPWAVAGVARILPLSLRDRLYELVARNRFRWFGRKTTCYMPSESVKNRFID